MGGLKFNFLNRTKRVRGWRRKGRRSFCGGKKFRDFMPRFKLDVRDGKERDNSVWWRGVENIRDRRVMCYVRGTRSDRGDEREDFSSFSPCNPWMSSELRVGSLQFVKSILEIWVQGGPETKKKIASSLREDGPLGTLLCGVSRPIHLLRRSVNELRKGLS